MVNHGRFVPLNDYLTELRKIAATVFSRISSVDAPNDKLHRLSASTAVIVQKTLQIDAAEKNNWPVLVADAVGQFDGAYDIEHIKQRLVAHVDRWQDAVE